MLELYEKTWRAASGRRIVREIIILCIWRVLKFELITSVLIRYWLRREPAVLKKTLSCCASLLHCSVPCVCNEIEEKMRFPPYSTKTVQQLRRNKKVACSRFVRRFFIQCVTWVSISYSFTKF